LGGEKKKKKKKLEESPPSQYELFPSFHIHAGTRTRFIRTIRSISRPPAAAKDPLLRDRQVQGIASSYVQRRPAACMHRCAEPVPIIGADGVLPRDEFRADIVQLPTNVGATKGL